MTLRINDIAPDFTATTTRGVIRFHEWAGESWVVLFSHPKDFTPVCTTELGALAALQGEFERRDCRVIGLSVDSLEDHEAWQRQVAETQGHAICYPLIADEALEVAKLYDMLPASESGTSSGRSALDNATVRNVFVIGPDKRIKLVLAYPMTTGRNFDEVLRVLDSMQLTVAHGVATPANWRSGERVVISPSVSDEEATKLYPRGWEAVTPYLRYVPQPGA